MIGVLPRSDVSSRGELLIVNVLTSRYKNWSRRRYAPLMCTPAVLYGVMCVVVAYLNIDYHSTVYICMPPTAFAGPSLPVWVMSNLLICLTVVIVYSCAYIKASRMGEFEKW